MADCANATSNALTNMQPRDRYAEPLGFLRLPQVLSLIPVSKATWWRGIRAGKYPSPIKLSQRVSAWRASDIQALLTRIGEVRDDV